MGGDLDYFSENAVPARLIQTSKERGLEDVNFFLT